MSIFKKIYQRALLLPIELWIILLLAASIRLAGSNNVFLSIDELAGLRRVLKFAEGDLNPHWFFYPTGYYYFLLLILPLRFMEGVLISGWTHPSDLFYAYLDDPMSIAITLRIAGVLVCIFAIFITYQTAKRMLGRRWAWVAALFLAISPFYAYWSTQIWPEALIILPSSICLYYAVLYTETGRLRHIIISGLAAGMAMSVKYNAVYLCAIIPCAVWLYTQLHENITKPTWHHVISSGLSALVGFVLLTPFAILDWKTFLKTFTDILIDYRGTSHLGLDAGYALQVDAPWTWWSQALNNISPGFFWIILTAILLLFFNWKKKYLLVMVPILVMVPFLALFGKAEFRHLIPILPVFGCVLAFAAQSIDSIFGRPKIISILIIILMLPGLRVNIIRIKDQLQPDTRIEARGWIEANIPEGTMILLDKWYTPHLVRTKEQVEYLIENKVADVYFKSYQKDMPRTVSYWLEFLPVAISSDEYGLSDDGLVVQPELLSPSDYANAGFEYVVLSEEIYGRFENDPSQYPLKVYYDSFFEACVLVHEVSDVNRPGPKISILRFSSPNSD